jgi:hypothetical protein
MADNRVIADIVRKGGTRLLDAAVDTLLPDAAKDQPKRRKTLLGGIAGTIATRIATRSVPGAIVMGGALLAKRLYDRRHAGQAPRAKEKAKPKA